MAKQIQNCWEPGYAARYDEPWFSALPIETQRRYKEQDLARAEAHRQMLVAATAAERKEAEAAFVALCAAQANINLATRSVGKTKNAKDLLLDLGVTVTERKSPAHEDPEKLRRARVELGLEPMEDDTAHASL